MKHVRSERRRNLRVGARLMVAFRVTDQVERYYGLTRSSNVGSGGILLPTSVAFPPGTRLRMKMRIPDKSQTLALTGEVVASREIAKALVYNTRIRFLDLDVKSREQLAELVAEFKSVPVPTDAG